MSAAAIRAVGRVLAMLTILILCLGVSSCAMLHASARPYLRISAPGRSPSALTVILDSPSAMTLSMLQWMVTQSARPGEHLAVIRSADDMVLASCTAPNPPTAAIPSAPVLPQDATSFQVASYRMAMTLYRARLRSTYAELRQRERRELADWAEQCTATGLAANRHPLATSRRVRLGDAIEAAIANVATLEQSGVPTGTRRVIVILGPDGGADPLSGLHADLQGTTVVVAGYPIGEDGAALQAGLLEARADSAIVLTPASDNRLPAVIDRGLGGTISVPLAHLSYGPAQFRLPSTATPTLMEVLNLLTVTYPGATATINGYTDDIPLPGGNVKLSWQRANAALTWLTQHGVAPSRLHAVGHGADYPIAPNLPGGQPRNRRVVIVIMPGL